MYHDLILPGSHTLRCHHPIVRLQAGAWWPAHGDRRMVTGTMVTGTMVAGTMVE
jgi:hypothetical protein